jgi:hypothetical protein
LGGCRLYIFNRAILTVIHVGQALRIMKRR